MTKSLSGFWPLWWFVIQSQLLIGQMYVFESIPQMTLDLGTYRQCYPERSRKKPNNLENQQVKSGGGL